MKSRIYFSSSTLGFYDEQDKLRFEHWPNDAVEVSAAVRNEFTGIPPDGKTIAADIDGFPVWQDVPEKTLTELILEAEQKRIALRGVADAEIAWRQDAFETGIATNEETSALTAWKKYRVLLMRVDTAKPAWPIPPKTS
ncbi:tail fiber assembly protein [Citrobacter farmeri]